MRVCVEIGMVGAKIQRWRVGSRLYHPPTGKVDMGLKEAIRLECGLVISCGESLCTVQRGLGLCLISHGKGRKEGMKTGQVNSSF